MNRLEGKIVVLTGGSTGIGLATAKLFVAEGAYVYITGRRQHELDAALAEIGHNGTAVQGDISNGTDLDRLYALVQRQHGHLDIVFANAGTVEYAPLGSVTEDSFDRQFDVNVKGTFFTVQKALPLLQDGGSIILNASAATTQALPLGSVYSGTKSAVRSFARAWGAELLERRIRVNVISPGLIDTPLIGQVKENNSLLEQLASKIPMKRLGTPNEIATSVLFLASDESSYISGIELFVDGGFIELGV